MVMIFSYEKVVLNIANIKSWAMPHYTICIRHPVYKTPRVQDTPCTRHTMYPINDNCKFLFLVGITDYHKYYTEYFTPLLSCTQFLLQMIDTHGEGWS